MRRFVIKALFAAALVHAAILLFGGLVLFRPKSEAVVRKDVEIVAVEAKPAPEKREPERKKAEEAPTEASDAPAPELRDIAHLEAPVAPPALAPLSLADLEGVLSDAGGEGSFASGGGTLSSGGRIGGTGIAASLAADAADIASLAELDQRPRAIFQAAPSYPAELRKRNLEGSVEVVFLVDKEGKVVSPKIERSTNPSFERPALEAVRQWRFEAGTRHGEKVAFKMRVPITFSAS